MKAITLTQPWATLVAIGAKRIETRDWPTHFRGRVAIHAAKAFPNDARTLAATEPFVEALTPWWREKGFQDPPRGVVVAVADLVQCWQFGTTTEAKIRERSERGELPSFEADFGNYDAGRFGFRLENVIALREPIPARGMLGLWNMPSDVERAVLGQLEAIAA